MYKHVEILYNLFFCNKLLKSDANTSELFIFSHFAFESSLNNIISLFIILLLFYTRAIQAHMIT